MILNPTEQQEELSRFEIKEREKRRCCQDKLDVGAKLLFCWLIDNSWLRKFGGGGEGGVICISVSRISSLLDVGERSVSRWSKTLAERGYLWISRRALPNCKPINVYHLSCLCPVDPDANQISFTDAGMWGPSDADSSTANLAGDAEPGAEPVVNDEESGANEETGQNGTSQPPARLPADAKLAGASRHNGHGQPPPRHLAGAKLATGSRHNGHGQPPPRHLAGAKLAAGNGHNGHGQVPKSDVIGRLQTKDTGESNGSGEAAPHKSAEKKAFKLPKFAPIPPDIFPSKLKPMLDECQRQIRRIQSSGDFKVKVAVKGKNFEWLQAEAARVEKDDPEKAVQLREKAAKLVEVDYVISDEGKAAIKAYEDRSRIIRERMNGIEVAA